MASTSERMSSVDTAWLRMDNPRNLMMIVGVWLLRPALDPAALRQRLENTLLRYARFRQKVVRETLGRRWVAAEDFDLQRHLCCETLRRRRGQSARAALQQRTSELATTALDPAHPLWQMHLIEHYEGGSALIVRIHHCIADGIALTGVMLSMADGAKGVPQPRQRPGVQAEDWLTGSVLQPMTAATVRAIDLFGDAVVSGMEGMAHPGRPMAGSRALARQGVLMLRDAARLALLPDDSATRLKGPACGRKLVAWCEPMPLDAVKAVGKALQCSVNDVLLSCVAGAIGHYLRARGDRPDGQEIRAMVPVNLRAVEDSWQLGNRFGLAPVLLPVGIANPVERLYAVRRAMRELKDSYEPLLAYALLFVSGLLPSALQDAISQLFLKKTTAVMTNVPGPTAALHVCGSAVRQSIFWVPSSGDVGVGVSIVSYAGGVQFGLITDRQRCDDPQSIIDGFAPEFDRLLLLALMLPTIEEMGAVPAGPHGG